MFFWQKMLKVKPTSQEIIIYTYSCLFTMRPIYIEPIYNDRLTLITWIRKI